MYSFRDCRSYLAALIAAALLSISVVGVSHATENRKGLPEAVRHMLVQSITMDGGRHFAATVRMAGEAVPEARDEIVFLLVLYAPNRVAEAKQVLGLSESNQLENNAEAPVAATDDGPPESAKAPEADGAKENDDERPVGFFSTRNLTGKVDIGGAVNTGNTDDENLVIGLALNRKDGPWTYDFKSAFEIQRRDSETTQQRFIADAAVDYDITSRLYTYGAAEYENDDFSGFNYRITSGGGLGYRIFVRPKLNWSVEAGPGVRIDSFEDTGNTSVTPAIRAFSDFAWDFSPYASFLHDIQTIQDGGLTIDTTAAIVARITERVSGQLSYQVRYNSDAPAGNEEVDTTTRLSLVYDF